MRLKTWGLLLTTAAMTLVPASVSAETSASCSQRSTGDVLAFFDDTGTACVHDTSASTFSVDASAYSSGPVGGMCSITGIGAACSSSTVTFTETRETDVLAGSVTVGGTFEGKQSATGSGYSQGGSAYSNVAVSIYAVAYSCDWNWYNDWQCYYGQAKSAYGYVACSPGSCTGSPALSVTVDVPYCNGYYCNVEWSRDSPYARIVVSYSIQAAASASGYARSSAHADGVVTLN